MNNKQRSFNWFYIFTILRQGDTGTKKKQLVYCTVQPEPTLTRTPLSVSVKPYTLRHFNNYFLSVTASSGTLRILALFTSGYNSVGTGVWEYRLRIRCRGILPPPARLAGGGCLVASHAPAVWAKIWHASQGVRRKKREWHDGYGLVQSVYA